MACARWLAAFACPASLSALPCDTDLAKVAASMPATLPNTSSSVSELEPSRLAPWMPTLEHSPAEYKPGSGDAVLPSALMPPIV